MDLVTKESNLAHAVTQKKAYFHTIDSDLMIFALHVATTLDLVQFGWLSVVWNSTMTFQFNDMY